MKKIKLIAALSFALAAPLVPFSAHAQKMTLKASDVHPTGYPTVVAVENMGKKLSDATNGRLKIQTFPGGVLGGEKEVIEQVQVGAIQLARISLGPVGAVVPDVNVFNLPFIFRSEEHMHKVIDGPIGNEIMDKVSNSPAKMVALAWMVGGTRSVYTKKPVKTPEDLKGLKLRVMGNPIFVDTMNAMGGNGISMGYGEVFSALQTGVVDGAENNAPSLLTSNHYTTGAKYYSQTNHLMIPELLVMSRVTWDKLSKEDQALVKKLAREAQTDQRGLWEKTQNEARTKLTEAGVQFSQVDYKSFYDATAPVRAKYGAQFADLIKRIEAVQ